jgi:hypothetical protein
MIFNLHVPAPYAGQTASAQLKNWIAAAEKELAYLRLVDRAEDAQELERMIGLAIDILPESERTLKKSYRKKFPKW